MDERTTRALGTAEGKAPRDNLSPVAILTPRIIQHVGLAAWSQLGTHAGAKFKVFQIDCDLYSQMLPLSPRVAVACVDTTVLEAIMTDQRHDPRPSTPRELHRCEQGGYCAAGMVTLDRQSE